MWSGMWLCFRVVHITSCGMVPKAFVRTNQTLIYRFSIIYVDILFSTTEKKILHSVSSKKMVLNWSIVAELSSLGTKHHSAFCQVVGVTPFFQIILSSFHRCRRSFWHFLYKLVWKTALTWGWCSSPPEIPSRLVCWCWTKWQEAVPDQLLGFPVVGGCQSGHCVSP